MCTIFLALRKETIDMKANKKTKHARSKDEPNHPIQTRDTENRKNVSHINDKCIDLHNVNSILWCLPFFWGCIGTAADVRPIEGISETNSKFNRILSLVHIFFCSGANHTLFAIYWIYTIMFHCRSFVGIFHFFLHFFLSACLHFSLNSMHFILNKCLTFEIRFICSSRNAIHFYSELSGVAGVFFPLNSGDKS